MHIQFDNEEKTETSFAPLKENSTYGFSWAPLCTRRVERLRPAWMRTMSRKARDDYRFVEVNAQGCQEKQNFT